MASFAMLRSETKRAKAASISAIVRAPFLAPSKMLMRPNDMLRLRRGHLCVAAYARPPIATYINIVPCAPRARRRGLQSRLQNHMQSSSCGA